MKYRGQSVGRGISVQRRLIGATGLLLQCLSGTQADAQARTTTAAVPVTSPSGATIIGHETAANLARAYDVRDSALITVIGGEDYAFGGFSLRVIPNIHSVGANSQRLEIHEYTARLMRLLGRPALVIPSHADAYGNPKPSAAALADRQRFVQEVRTASPRSRVIVPTWFEPIVAPARR